MLFIFFIFFVEEKGSYYLIHLVNPIMNVYIDGLPQGRRNSTANALELHLSYTNPLT